MNTEKAIELLKKYENGTISAEDKALLETWYIQKAAQSKFQLSIQALEESVEHLKTRLPLIEAKKVKLWPRAVGIAAAVIGLAVGVYFFTAPSNNTSLLSSRTNAKDLNDIAPGGNRATLTLANGKTINLSDKKSGVIVGDALTYDDNTLVIRSDSEGPKDRSLETRDDKQDNNGSSSRGNEGPITAITPRGGTYSIILQDGTKVWLNADSKLEFFSNYRNKLQRIVKLIKGEAYLEVAKDAKRPFKVQTAGQEITVLGTHFNISAYPDDVGIKTTLVEGSVKVGAMQSLSASGGEKPEGREVVLKPNEQSLIANNNITVTEVNAAQAIAWKNGKFAFENEPLASVMKKVARWYNVTVIFDKQALKNITFDGSLSRYDNVSRILKSIEFAGKVKFKIEGQKIIVTE
ncbi:FecR family protein [Pedobacter africanus]|nr:FecR family protein [Pedobacter africanus]